MELSPYNFNNYKLFILEWINNQPKNGHGIKTVIAQHTSCNPAYVTQVLNGDAHFSLEQIEKLRTLLGLNLEEFDFFLLLVEKDRAGTNSLKKYFNDKIELKKIERKKIENRVKNQAPLAKEVETKYFSTWMYAAVHAALTISRMQDPKVIAYQLKLHENKVREIINYLLQAGIIIVSKNGYETGEVRIHLSQDSDSGSRHHSNWRLQAMGAYDLKNEAHIHYSSVVSISQSDVHLIRETILSSIEKAKGIIRESKEETIYSFCVDFFKVSID